MKVVLHDLSEDYNDIFLKKADKVIVADGKYAPCQGCFKCWTKHPAQCFMKDRLFQIARVMGIAEEVVIITENVFGSYSPAIKNVLDRGIGTSTPFSTYRGGQMHHTVRYKDNKKTRVIVYGKITDGEKETFRYIVKRNRINEGAASSAVEFIDDSAQLEGVL